MQDSIHPDRLTRARLLVTAALLSGFIVAGCGGSSHGPTTRPSSGTTISASSTETGSAGSTAASGTATGGGTAKSGSSAPGAPPGTALAFSECMRSGGVPNFPDPEPGGALEFPVTGGNIASPAFRSAQAKCKKLLPNGGPPGAGSTTHASAQTLAKLVRIAECMREHGISEFPDPRTSVPANPVGYQEITDFDGAILLFPRTLNLQSPAYRQDLAACGAPPLGLHH